MGEQVPIGNESIAPDSTPDESANQLLIDTSYLRLAIVNIAFLGEWGAGSGKWLMIDAGVNGTSDMIAAAAQERFGEDAPPAAIILTHGHFDHVGALNQLADLWDVAVYAHPLEHPFLNGTRSYPPPDPSVGGGMMARLSTLYPRGPVNVSARLRALPEDGSLPGAPGWRWIHTPGHTQGHVSLWREQDRTLIAGDAFITTNQESAYAVATQKPELHGPPMYYTENWEQARESVKKLAALEPSLVITGHGRPMHGPELREALHRLADDFRSVAMPH